MQLDKDFLNREVKGMRSHSKPKPLSPHATPLAQTWTCVMYWPYPVSSKQKPKVFH